MPEITEKELRRRLSISIERVRHRGLQKRVNKLQPNTPKNVKASGQDWSACSVCLEETNLIMDQLRTFENGK